MLTPGTCPHGRDVFIWLGDGPWLGDEKDPDHGRYPWVHGTTMTPGHLTVCELMPFATAAEAGQVCACGHESRSHPPSGPVPDAPAVAARAMRCLDCGCDGFRHRAEDLERWRAAQPRWAERATEPAMPPAAPVSPPPVYAQLALFGGEAS